MNKLIVAMLSAIILLMFFGDNDELVLENNYCEMVSTYKQSNGKNGWPDYKGNYSKVCGGE